MSPASSATALPRGRLLPARGAPWWQRMPTAGAAAAAGTVLLTAVPLRSGGEGAALLHLTPADAGAVAVVAIVGARVLLAPEASDAARLRSWVTLPLLAVLVAAAVATVAAANAMLSLSGMVRSAQLYVIVPLATCLALRRRADLQALLGAVLALGVVQSVVAIGQYATGTGASYGGTDVRAVGTFGAYTIMALPAVLTAALVTATALALAFRGWVRAAAWASIALLVPALAFSLSRGFWLAAVVAVLATVAVHDHAKAAVLALALVLAVPVAGQMASGGGASPVAERIASGVAAAEAADQSVRDRYALWGASLRMWRDNPWAGVGIKGFERYRDSYVPFGFSGRSDVGDAQGGFRQVALLTPHNTYLLVLSEQGALGALAFLGLLGGLGHGAVRRVRRDIRAGEEPIVVAFGLAAIGLLAAFLISSLYSDPGGSTVMLNATVAFGGLLWLASGAGLPEETT